MFRISQAAHNAISRTGSKAESGALKLVGSLRAFGQRHLGISAKVKSRGVLARTWSIGTTSLWIAVLLTAYVLAYFL